MTPFAKFVVLTLIASAAYYAVTAKVPQETKQSKSSPVLGWEELDACLPMQSLDGRQTLSFSENHTVQLNGANVPGQKAEGVWAFDESGKRYLMTLGSEQKSYVLVRPEDSEVCILARGELKSSDMGESWYSRTLSDMQGDLADADRQ
jgi:hypothetical protein